MSESTRNVRRALELFQRGFENINKANETLSGGPASYYMERMIEYVETLFTRYAPFKEGDRAVICKAPNCENAWKPKEECLQKGAKCTVRGIDYYKGRWRVDVELDVETWIDHNGMRHATEEDQKHTFCLDEDNLVKI